MSCFLQIVNIIIGNWVGLKTVIKYNTMLQHLNFYSRYNRIRNHQDIPTLYQLIDCIQAATILECTSLCIQKNAHPGLIHSYSNRPHALVSTNSDRLEKESDSSQFRRCSSQYEQRESHNLCSETNEPKLLMPNILNKQYNPNLSSNIPLGIINQHNLDTFNCLQTQSIGNSQKDDELAQFPELFDKALSQQNISSDLDVGEMNIWRQQLRTNNRLGRKKSMDMSEVKEPVEANKTERLARVCSSDIQRGQHHWDPDNCHQNYTIGKNSSNLIEELEEEPGMRGQDIYEHDVKREECNGWNDDRRDAASSDQHHDMESEGCWGQDGKRENQECSGQDENRENEGCWGQDGKRESEAQDEMYFGYEDQSMRIGFSHYKSGHSPQQQEISVLEAKQDKVNESIIKQNQKQADKQPQTIAPQRKPFKKCMMNKKALNPRMAQSTIVNDLSTVKPAKVNFKKVMIQNKSKSRVKFDDLPNSNKKLPIKTQEKKKLLASFFDQN